MISQNNPNKLNRRTWLRNAAIATTGAAVLPSLLTNCTDHFEDTGIGGTDDVPPADLDMYRAAAENLFRMSEWYGRLYNDHERHYAEDMYKLIKGGPVPPESFKDIIIDIFTKLGIGVLEAMLEEFPGVGPAVAASIEGFSKWASETKEKEGNVDTKVAVFLIGLENMHDRVRKQIDILTYSGNNYRNLREAFKAGATDGTAGTIVFNDKRYTIKQLALMKSPDRTTANASYDDDLTEAAMAKFRIYFWNVMFVQAGKIKTYDTFWPQYTYDSDPRKIISDLYANNTDIPGAYFRAYYDNSWGGTHIREYQFLFDDKKLDEKTSAELFKDTIRGHVVNPDALFERDYVFKQFHTKKYPFGDYCDVATEPSKYYDCSNYTFTGGILNLG